MLPKQHRLPSSEIKSVMRTGRRVHNAGVTLFYKRLDPRLRGDDKRGSGDDKESRFAVIVPGGVDKRAVVRNRIRRVAREAVRLVLPQIAPGRDCVIFVRKDPSSVLDALRAAGLL